MNNLTTVLVSCAILITGCDEGGGGGGGTNSSGEPAGGTVPSHSTGYVMANAIPGWFDGSYYMAQLDGSSTSVFKITAAGSDLVLSKNKGSSNAGADGGAAFHSSGLVVYSAYEYSSGSPAAYGTDFGTLTLGSSGTSTYVPNTPISRHDWDGSVSIRDTTALLFRRSGYGIVFNKFDLLVNSVSADITVESDDDNGTILNPVGTHISSSMAAVSYDEVVSDGHNYRVTFFSSSDGVQLSRELVHTDGSGVAYAKTTATHSNGQYLVVAFSAIDLSAYGDPAGRGILICVFDSNRQLVSRFIANRDHIVGDQVFPSVYITQSNRILVSFQSWSEPAAYIFLYAIDGTLLDQEVLADGGYGRSVNFGEGPLGSVLASYTDSKTKLVRLDVSAGSISKIGLF